MNRFRNILYVAKTSVTQDSAMARAVSLAENNQAELTVVDVIPPVRSGGGLPNCGDLQAAMVNERRKELESLIAPYKEGRDVHLGVLVGKTFLEVIRAVLRNGHDLVIKPAENPDRLERLFGSDDMHLLRKCPCPIWLTKPGEKFNYECIVAAIDFDPGEPESIARGLNHDILELSSSLALSDFAVLHLVHAWDAPAEGIVRIWGRDPEAASSEYVGNERAHHQAGMDLLRRRLLEMAGREAYGYLSPRFHMARGSAVTVVPELATQLQADLVVMGTVGRAGIPGLLIGNTAEAVLDQLQCSVLAVKPTGFTSPVKSD